MKKRLQVVDFFCGAGGFSEGFRQQKFEIIKGIDNWQPAIDSHNLNHQLNDKTQDILSFWNTNTSDIDEINKVPNSEVIIGSPSCVSFSMSNKSGKADKTLGLQLIEAYLRVIAVKKHQPKSILKAWYMENVPKSRDYVRDSYTFADLKLNQWAKSVNKNPKDIALNVRVNGGIFNAGDYGAPQERKRYITGEWVQSGGFVEPIITHKVHVSSSDVRNSLPSPIEKITTKYADPNYKKLNIPSSQLTDHFYDTGLYKLEWEKAQHLKVNHPFMGKMSFPELESRTCRTITATRSASTRESLIYKSEYEREGDGEFRLPTIREVACLMGYPIVYQFVGSEGSKWRQIGNSVCPHMSAALAMSLREKFKLPKISTSKIAFTHLKKNYKNNNLVNLNDNNEKIFNKPRKRMPNARFRRHAFKMGNMTVDLMNYHPNKATTVAKKWYLSTYYGTGKGHGVKTFSKNNFRSVKNILMNNLNDFEKFNCDIENKIITNNNLQKTYEDDLLIEEYDNPLIILKRLADIIVSYESHLDEIRVENTFLKEKLPIAQVMATFGLMRLIYEDNTHR